jgi:lipoprotein-anchoring transpeptidase ErfK/SrfK
MFLFSSCSEPEKKKVTDRFQYEKFKDSLLTVKPDTTPETNNIFDMGTFTPGIDSLDKLLVDIDTVLTRLKRMDKLSDTERAAVNENLRMLDSFYSRDKKTAEIPCIENKCGLYAHILKSKQLLFLYINGEVKDSFPVSTGIKKYTTPNMSLHPRGPIFTKYTSRKFPGGNYKRLGNMPYAVFVKGGYAIHGTTPGNFSKLGRVASHGCIRLHPDNARIFFELVKTFGLSNTWVKVTDSL